MTQYEILLLSVTVPAIGLAIDLWNERHQNDVFRRVTIVQWFAIAFCIYGGVQLALTIPPLSKHLPLACGIIASGATYGGMKLGMTAGKILDNRMRRQNAAAARKEVMYG